GIPVLRTPKQRESRPSTFHASNYYFQSEVPELGHIITVPEPWQRILKRIRINESRAEASDLASSLLWI
uniref:Replication protein n=1 Tax=Steinernema glaseri TaxID=37863 RepID=A0A1I7YHY0_9BILA